MVLYWCIINSGNHMRNQGKQTVKLFSLVVLLLLAGCQSDKKPLLQTVDTDKDNTSVHGDSKPLYREVTDEFGIRKGWEF